MKKIITFMLAAALIICGCVQIPDTSAKESFEIALITDMGDINDKSFNQGAWEGITAFAEKNQKSFGYFLPFDESDEQRLNAIKIAVDQGAKAVVCPGFLFTSTIETAQQQFPNTMFLVLDVAASGLSKVTANTALVTYKEEQSGYMAGYAAVKEGYTKLGFLGGMELPSVIRYGNGFIAGANDAANELGIADHVDIKHWYSDTFARNDATDAKMEDWYKNGTEVVFACGGAIYFSAVEAAERHGGKVIGVDRDQSEDSDLIITSALKAVAPSVETALAKLYENGGKWPESYAGKEIKMGAENNSSALAIAKDSWRFEKFTVEDYNKLLDAVKSGVIKISDSADTLPTVDITVDYQK